MCHVSPERLDFKTFYPGPIPNGLNNTCVNVVGMGDIELIGPNLTPHNVLFVSSSSIRLISVKMLSQSCDFTSHFSIDGCWITNNSSSVIARGVAMGSPASNLYELRARVQAEQQPNPSDNPSSTNGTPLSDLPPPAPKPLIPNANPPLRCSAHMPVLPTSRILTNDSLSWMHRRAPAPPNDHFHDRLSEFSPFRDTQILLPFDFDDTDYPILDSPVNALPIAPWSCLLSIEILLRIRVSQRTG